MFAYQSFDAIDGKQARRTGMAGPLGEMFDHGTFLKKKEKRHVSLIIRVGCDAINTTVTIICIFTAYLFDDLLVRSCACSAGFEPWSFMVDRRVADSYASQFLPDYMGGVLHGYDLHTHVRSKNQLTRPG